MGNRIWPLPTDAAEIVFKMLNAAAEKALICPSNDEIAKRIGSRSTGTAARFVHKIEREGLIKVERYYRRWRVVTIVATGKSTARAKAWNRDSETIYGPGA